MEKFFICFKYVFIILLFSNQALILGAARAESQPDTFDSGELPSLDLDELLATDVQVTSAMKRLQNVSDTAASIYVLTGKEIMQSGVTSVMQALKLVPGMQVRQIDSNQWAITSRNTAGRYSSKLLVMIDGQSIYNPAFAGVYWEALNIPLYDIERIEVVRGQGGLLWGSNATNGVVNIISKHSADTRGTLLQAATGTQLDSKVNFRVGGDLANYSSFRIYGGFEETDKASVHTSDIAINGDTSDIAANDDGQKKSIGGRTDLNINENMSLLVQTQYTDIKMGQDLILANLDTYEGMVVEDQYTREHFQLMARLEHRLSSVSNQMLQLSTSSQKGEQYYYQDAFLISDADYQMNTLINNIQFDWGVNYRYIDIDITGSGYTAMHENMNSYTQGGGFLQAQFNLIPDELKLVLGDRSERNSFTGWEHQPMARLLWHLNPRHTLWSAISQGVRIPSIFEYNVSALTISESYNLFTGELIRTEITGSDDVDAETSLSKELGYRYTAKTWNVDLSVFHTKASDALIAEGNINDDYTLLSYDFVSDGELTTYGGDAVIKWQFNEQLAAEIGYSFTSYKYDLPAGTGPVFGYDSNLQQLLSKVHYKITPSHSLFATYRFEGGEAYDTSDYSVFDLNWKWQVTPVLALSLTGNNLLYGKHLEYNNTDETYTIPTYVEPSYVAGITAVF